MEINTIESYSVINQIDITQTPLQWEENVYTPKQILSQIKKLITSQSEFKNIWIEGEIVNYKPHNDKIFFSLKENDVTLDCVIFNSSSIKDNSELKDGRKIRALGYITLFDKNGRCQFIVRSFSVVLDKGEVLKKIEELKETLQKEGLFDEARKRELPKYPKTLGVATSLFGAALRDIVQSARKRFPPINIVIAPCFVQGKGAEESIAQAIQLLNQRKVDVIIAGRGGGSFEDLIAFSSEIVVRAFANSQVPIVSAVGHQIDKPLSDLAADKSAITPTKAVEISVPDVSEIMKKLDGYQRQIEFSSLNKIKSKETKFTALSQRVIFTHPEKILEKSQNRFENLEKSLFVFAEKVFLKIFSKFQILNEKIEFLNPLLPLEKGYAIVRSKDQQIKKSIEEIKEKEELYIHLSGGYVKVLVKKIHRISDTFFK
ncbi:MAG: exodeoxyribonuclease VII large subunit [Leptospiraceae bacterium]|nr:exodeoxyribonuclease VII large subunit [Leptospiraceae bacterium]MDW7976283.1 exodeoxyribonuclease VII large subunit [Leptospiraceae bacterium]